MILPEPTEQPPVSEPRRRRLPLVLAGAGAALAVLVAVVLVVKLPHRTAGQHGARASASPAAPALSPETYQQALTKLDTDLTPLVQAVTAMTTYRAASTAAGQLKAKVDADATVLEGITAPAPVRAAHEHLAKAVRELGNDAGILGDEAGREIRCVGSAVVTDLALSTGGVWLHAAVKELATADPGRAYKVGGFLPETTATTDRRRGDNGTMLKKPDRRGANQLKIDNTGTNDAVVILAPQGSKTATFMVYVRSGSSHTVTGIPDGTYLAYVLSGNDWDAGARMFGRYCHYERTPDTMALTSDRNGYSVGTLNVRPSNQPFFADGTDPDSFPR